MPGAGLPWLRTENTRWGACHVLRTAAGLCLLLVNGASRCVDACEPLLVVPYPCTFSKPRCCPVVRGAHVSVRTGARGHACVYVHSESLGCPTRKRAIRGRQHVPDTGEARLEVSCTAFAAAPFSCHVGGGVLAFKQQRRHGGPGKPHCCVRVGSYRSGAGEPRCKLRPWSWRKRVEMELYRVHVPSRWR